MHQLNQQSWETHTSPGLKEVLSPGLKEVLSPGLKEVLCGCLNSVEWNGGMEWWNGLDWTGMDRNIVGMSNP